MIKQCLLIFDWQDRVGLGFLGPADDDESRAPRFGLFVHTNTGDAWPIKFLKPDDKLHMKVDDDDENGRVGFITAREFVEEWANREGADEYEKKLAALYIERGK